MPLEAPVSQNSTANVIRRAVDVDLGDPGISDDGLEAGIDEPGSHQW